MEIKDNAQQKLTVVDGGRTKEYEEEFLKKLIDRTETDEEYQAFTKRKIGKLHIVPTDDV